MKDISPRALQILRILGEHARERKPMPTLREIGPIVGIRSTNGVSEHLQRLERDGFIRRSAHKSRCMELTPAGAARCGLAAHASGERKRLVNAVFMAAQTVASTYPFAELAIAVQELRDAVAALAQFDAERRAA